MLVTLGLTPALQRVMVFERYVADRVNRAAETYACAAGKAVNAARAARIMKSSLPVAVMGVQGGAAGAVCRADLKAADLIDHCVEASGETRTCVTVIDRATGQVTELVEEAPFVAPNERKTVLSRLNGPPARLLLCAGTLARGTSDDFYGQAASKVPGADLLIDARGAVLLAGLAAPTSARRVAKLNAEEARSTTGAAALPEAMAALHGAGATHVVITDGGRAVYASDGGAVRTITPPKVSVLNTTGCGDCLAGVLAAELVGGTEFFGAVRVAVAASAASAEHVLPAHFDRERAAALLQSMQD